MTAREFLKIALDEMQDITNVMILAERLRQFCAGVGDPTHPSLEIHWVGPEAMTIFLEGIKCGIHRVHETDRNWITSVDNGASSRKIPWKTKTAIVPL